MVLDVAFQVFGQLPDPACQQRDLDVCAAGVLPVQLELLDIQRFRILSHFEAPIIDQEFSCARRRSSGNFLMLLSTVNWADPTRRAEARPAAPLVRARGRPR